MTFSNTINNLVNRDEPTNLTKSFKHGQFSYLNKTTASLSTGIDNVRCDLRLRTDFQVVGKSKKVQFDDVYTDYSGYNKKYITDCGVFNPEAAIDEFAKTDFGRRVVTRDINSQILKLPMRDNHTAFLYNMMISWGKAYLAKMTGHENGITKVHYTPFSNAHCTVATPWPQPHTIDIRLEAPAYAHMAPEYRNAENFFTRPYVIHYNAQSKEQELFYVHHIYGRDSVTDLNFDVAIPGLQNEDFLLDPISRTWQQVHMTVDVPYHNADLLWMWIYDYVCVNRLQEAFGAVLELFGLCFAHPIWSSVEACVWDAADFHIVLSTFEPTRGRLRNILDGEQYITNQIAYDYPSAPQVIPAKYLLDSALTNYYMWYGLYSIVHNVASSLDDWRSAYTTINDDLRYLQTPEMPAYAISAIIGQEVTSCLNEGCGLFISLERMRKVEAIRPTKVNDGPRTYPVNTVYAPVSGSLLLGTLNGELAMTRHLSPQQSYVLDGGKNTIRPTADLLGIANVYRLFGNTVQLREVSTYADVVPWAPVNECIIEPGSLQPDMSTNYVYKLIGSDPRAGRSHPLPQLMGSQYGLKLQLVINKPSLVPIVFKTAHTPLEAYSFNKQLYVSPTFRVSRSFRCHSSVFRAAPAKEYVEDDKDFTSSTPLPGPIHPEPVRVLDSHQTASASNEFYDTQPMPPETSHVYMDQDSTAAACATSPLERTPVSSVPTSKHSDESTARAEDETTPLSTAKRKA